MVKYQNPKTENRPMYNKTRNQGYQENSREISELLSYCGAKTIHDEK